MQDSKLTTAEISQINHSLQASLHTIQEIEVNKRFRHLETKMENVEKKVGGAERHKRNNVRRYEYGAMVVECTD